MGIMKQTATTLNGRTVYMAEVPKDDLRVCYFFVGTNNKLYRNIGQLDDPLCDLPSGNWRPLGLCSEIKEAIAAGLVEKNPGLMMPMKWKHYGKPNYHYKDTAIKSLHSFIQSHHFNPETTVILIKE